MHIASKATTNAGDATDGRIHDFIQSGISAVAHGAACAGHLLSGFGPAVGSMGPSVERIEDGGGLVIHDAAPTTTFARRRANKLAQFTLSPIKRAKPQTTSAGVGKRGRIAKEALPARKNRPASGAGNRAISEAIDRPDGCDASDIESSDE